MHSAPSTHLKDQIRLTDWAHLKSEFVWAYDGPVDPPYRNAKVHHPGQSALYLQSGTGRVETEEGTQDAVQGQWIFPKEGTRHQIFSDDAAILSTHFHLYWPGGQPLFNWPVALVLDGHALPRLEKQTRTLIRMVEREAPGAAKGLPWRYGSVAMHFRIQRGFSSWLSTYVESLTTAGVVPSRLSRMDPRILQAVNALDELPLSHALNEEALAADVDLSPSQLSRLFTGQFSLTPRQYFEARKINRAKNLIRTAPLSIKQITYELGFSSLPSFSRWFRKNTGHSPRAFQKQSAR